MVHRKINSGKTVISIILLGIFSITLAFAVCIFIKSYLDNKNIIHEINEIVDEREMAEKNVKPKIEKIDFQPMIDNWVNSTSGEKSVMVYDLDLNKIVGSYNTTKNYNMASLYKLFVVYEGYKRLESGDWQEDAMAGTTGLTILKCLDKSIRESYSPCAETLWKMIGHDKLDEITGLEISSLMANSEDILKIMQTFYAHSEITNEKYLATMKDSFLVQPPTDYNWRQGLPSGFSEKVNVYNKVGWDYNERGYWNVYHDVAIIEFPENKRHFIAIVMTSHVPYQKIRDFGAEFEKTFNKY